jgi:ribosomal protein S18 acetylase RimI-like enzyme
LVDPVGVDGFDIRELTGADVPAAIALSSAQGFRDRTGFFELVLRTSTCRALAGVVDGRLIATGVATANGPVGWLGGIVVDAEFRRRGLGRAVTEELCRGLRAAGCVTISLESTDAGRPLYEEMGFRLATNYHQLQADHLPIPPVLPDGAVVRRLAPADWPAIFELDRLATAEDRSAPLRVLAALGSEDVPALGGSGDPATAGGGSGGSGERPTAAAGGNHSAERPTAGAGGNWVLERDGVLAGFLIPAERAYGAVIAPRFGDGLYLLDLHRHVVPSDAHVRAGIPDEHGAAWRELQERGWQETWRAPRYLLGPDIAWRPDWIWGQINSAMG